MSIAVRRFALIFVLALALPLRSLSQALPAEQVFSYPMDLITRALDSLGASEGRLPTLDGFVSADPAQLSQYAQPYYQLLSEVRADANGGTFVRVSARITALYSEAAGRHAEYRTLLSNGRLEADILQRLARELQQQGSQPRLDRKAIEATLADIRSRRAAAELQRAELTRRIGELESLAAPAALPRMLAVDRAGAEVLASPAEKAATLFRARAHDEFEVVEERDGWVQVRLGGERRGWIRRSRLDEAATTAGFSTPRLGFQVVRENVMQFGGNWAELKGKTTLFLWVRPETDTTADRWAFAQRMFEERAETTPVEGIVVVFLGEPGVAAATVRDIKRWTGGTLADAAFRARCSLDPPRAFSTPKPSTKRLARNDEGSGPRRSSP